MREKSIQLEDTICKLESIISADLEEATVMMDIEKGQYYSLNTVGSKIWGMIDEPITVETLCERLMENFEVSPELCQQEVLTYLTRLLELGIIALGK